MADGVRETGLSRRGFMVGAAGAVGVGVLAAPLLTGVAWAQTTVNVRNVGAVGDGSHDDGPAIRTAVSQVNSAGGGTVYFPAGTYRCVATSALLLGSNLTVLGDGAAQSVIAFEAAALTTFAQNTGDAVTVKNLTVRRNSDFAAVLFEMLSHNGFTFDGVTLDGRRDIYPNNYCHGLQLGVDNGTASNLKLINGTKLTKISYGLFQANPSTGTTNTIEVRNCTFTQNYNDDLEFNAPNGLMTGITVDSCTFSNNQQQVEGQGGFGVGIAHCSNATVSNCTFTDYYHEAVHIEDRSSNIKVLGSTFTRCGKIQYADIHVVSSSDTVLIQNNTINSADNTSANFSGCVVCNQAGAGNPPSHITVDNNRINCGPTNGVVFQVNTGAVTNNTFTTTSAAHDYIDWGSTNITISGNTP